MLAPLRRTWSRLFIVGCAFVILGAGGVASARADDTSTSTAADTGVARISVVNGSVTIKRADSGDSIAAATNAPLSVGDYVMTNDSSRAEVQLDNNDVVRLGSDAQLRFTSLDAPANGMQLAAGTIEVKSLQRSAGRPSVQTPSVTIEDGAPGRYRVDVTDDGDTLLAVRSGSANVLMPQGSQTIAAGTSVRISGNQNDPQVVAMDNIADDGFDSWNAQRDQYLVAVSSDPYANSGIVGLSDLDAYGHWVSYPSYGNVWVANTYPMGWAPYQYGRWVWQPYYGWTWVGYEPWGWAPYHYGRWFYAQNLGWAWYPGPVYVRPVYRPALVAFFGFGGGGAGFSFNLAFGNVGWVPLAPYEPFHQWWGPGYVNHTTIVYNYTNVTNITNIYHNAAVPGGVAVVSHENFTNGGAYHYIPVSSGQLHNVALVRSALPVVPTKQNLAPTTWNNAHAASATVVSSRFAKLPAPAKTPASFTAQQTAVQTAVHSAQTTVHTTNSPWDRFNSTAPGGNASTTYHPGNGTGSASVSHSKTGNKNAKPAGKHATNKGGQAGGTSGKPGGSNGSPGSSGHQSGGANN
ncbi:MAG: FecR domain-containing protein [Candidatus Eremiobacteraeota bacterium]|nr:FecR domain-containing protein [Candidatus Eremiobacteraeota bacterium]